MGRFLMPSLGADMEAGTLVEWLKQPGDAVNRGDVIAVVETQKGAIEVEVFETGVLEKLLVQPGARVPVGTPLAVIRGAGEPAAAAAKEEEEEEIPPAAEAAPRAQAASSGPAPAPPATPPPAAISAARARISPAARRRAQALGIDAGDIAGSGPGGAVTLADVERAAKGAPAATPSAPRKAARGIDPAAMREAIAAAMARAKREIPHYYLSHSVDLEPALAWLEAANRERPPAERLLPAALLIKAVARAVVKVPEMNGFMGGEGFRPSPQVHAGVAIAIRGGGLAAPAIHDADGRSVDELMAKLRDLVARTRAGSLRSSELSDPTITITSLGERGVEALFPIIYPPQVAIVGFGTPAPRPWVVDGAVLPRRVIGTTLSADHRVGDGHRGALFLAEIQRLLQRPEEL